MAFSQSEFKLRFVELLNRIAARREQASGRSDVDVSDEQPFFTIWLVAQQCPVGTHDRRSGWRPGTCDINSGEIASVLSGTAQDCFLME